MKKDKKKINLKWYHILAIIQFVVLVGLWFYADITERQQAERHNNFTYCGAAYDCNKDWSNCKYTNSEGKEISGLNCSKYLNRGE